MSLSPSNDSRILDATVDLILSAKRFDDQLFYIMKGVYTDHKKANNLTNLIICFFLRKGFFFCV